MINNYVMLHKMQAHHLKKLINKLMFYRNNNCLLKCYVNKGLKNQFLESFYHCVVSPKYCRGLVESDALINPGQNMSLHQISVITHFNTAQESCQKTELCG